MNIQAVSKESQIGNKICNTDFILSAGSGWSPMASVLASVGGTSVSQEQGVALVHVDSVIPAA